MWYTLGMRNSQEGFIFPLVIAIVALVVGGGAYVYIKNAKPLQIGSTQTSVTNQNIPAEQETNHAKPVIYLISPASTTPQTLVTITGSGFIGNNDIKFTSMLQPTMVAYACGVRARDNSTIIQFGTGPSSQDPFVSDCKGGAGVKGIVLQGLYNVSVINNNGISNSVSFIVNSTSTHPTQMDETADWQTYVDKRIELSFKYPQGWSVEQCYSEENWCLYLYSSLNPYGENPRLGNHLKPGVMKAIFETGDGLGDGLGYSEQGVVNYLIQNYKSSDILSVDTVTVFSAGELSGVKYEKVDNSLMYIIPQGSPGQYFYSTAFYASVFFKDPAFEKVLATFKFTSSVGE